MASWVEPMASQSSTWKPPSPGSIEPLPSCSPFSGQSSSNTNAVTVAVFNGLNCSVTVTGANVHTPAVQAGAGIGAPLVVCPQVATLCPVGVVPALDEKQAGFCVGSDALPVLKALAASPGWIER